MFFLNENRVFVNRKAPKSRNKLSINKLDGFYAKNFVNFS